MVTVKFKKKRQLLRDQLDPLSGQRPDAKTTHSDVYARMRRQKIQRADPARAKTHGQIFFKRASWDAQRSEHKLAGQDFLSLIVLLERCMCHGPFSRSFNSGISHFRRLYRSLPNTKLTY